MEKDTLKIAPQESYFPPITSNKTEVMRKDPHYHQKAMNHFTMITFSIHQEDNS